MSAFTHNFLVHILAGLLTLHLCLGFTSAQDLAWFRQTSEGVECKQPNGQFDHPKYCDLFVNCWEGSPTVSKCVYGLVFNETSAACDYKENVDCKGRTLFQNMEERDPRCKEPYGTFSNPSNCSEYFVCNAGNVAVKKCSDRTFFRPARGVCPDSDDPNCFLLIDACLVPDSPGCQCVRQQEREYGHKVPEFPSFPTIPGGGRPSHPAKNCRFKPQPPIGNDSRCEQPNGIFRDYNNCHQYFVCEWATAKVKTCPEDTYFKPESQGYPSSADPNCFMLIDPCIVPQSKDCKCEIQY